MDGPSLCWLLAGILAPWCGAEWEGICALPKCTDSEVARQKFGVAANRVARYYVFYGLQPQDPTIGGGGISLDPLFSFSLGLLLRPLLLAKPQS